MDNVSNIFSDNSTSYYYSSLLFPPGTRKDVFRLYAYLRTADDFVDELPQDEEGFRKFRMATLENWEGGNSGDPIVDGFLELARREGFRKEWVESFLDSMDMDLHRESYSTMEETLEYVYGSAEVVGLMMADILGLEKSSYENARMLGRSMQYCNFIRDIEEDNRLGRQYFPEEELERFGLESLRRDEIDEENFRRFVHRQIKHYRRWQRKAEEGFSQIPRRSRIPVRLSSRLYRWTSDVIEQNPMVVYREKVKPSKARITAELLRSIC